LKTITKGALARCFKPKLPATVFQTKLVHMDAGSNDRLAQWNELLSMLILGHYPAAFFTPVYMSKTG